MISLPELSIRRPVFAWMLMIALVLFGAICFKRLGISQMPDIDFPTLTISANWEGAAPEILEAEIVDRLEQAIISVEGVKEISSNIKQGQANITLEFDIDRNIDSALQEVQSALSQVRLPLNVDPPTIKKSNPDEQPILWLGISSTTRNLHDLIVFTDPYIKDQFQTISGVGEIVLSGFTERNLRIWVNNNKLRQYELTILDIRDAIRTQHLETAAGRIENSQQELNLRVMGEGLSPQEIGEILIASRGGKPIYNSNIRIKDIAKIEDGLSDVRRLSRVNGVPGLGLGIKKQRGANAVAVGQAVKEKVIQLSKTLPSDIKLVVNFDSTVFIKESIEETEFTLVLSAIATAFVCWLFLGSFRPTFNILLSIPTSIIGSLIVIYFMGFTLNLFTILGLALAIGIVVDDAIMVLENIYRHQAMGKDRINAAIDGANQITFAAIAATIAVIAIFLPVAFMTGAIGKFFFQFGVTITAAVALSLLEAITLTPMRCSQMLAQNQNSNFFVRFLDQSFLRLASIYQYLLTFCLKIRWLVIIFSIALFIASLSLLKSIRKEFIPAQDQSVFIVRVQTAIGSSLEFTDNTIKDVEKYLQDCPEVLRVFSASGGFGGGDVNTGMLFVTLKARNDRKLSQSEFMNQARVAIGKIKNIKRVNLQDLSMRGFTAQRGYPLEFNIRGAEWSILAAKSQEIVDKLQATGLVQDLDTDYRLGQPEIRVWPKRDVATSRAVDIQEITDTVSSAIGGLREGKFTNNGRRYDLRIRLEADDRAIANDILQLDVRNRFGEIVPVADLVRIETTSTLQTITRKNRERSVSIFANINSGSSQAKALEQALVIAKESLPEGYQVHLAGGAQTFLESFNSLYFVLYLGVIVAYMVLASQFNSYIHPVTVLLALPFSLTGAIAALYFTGNSINLFSMIGIILLMGIVKKNSILLVEFTNHQRFTEKMALDNAILSAAPVRLRPILMTSLATIAAAIPPALALGPGAESRIPMSITIIGGVLISTFFTLFVVPCAYKVFSKLERSTE